MPLKAFSVCHNRENRKTREEKNTLSGQIEPLVSLTAHLLCFWENGSLPFDNKNHGGKKTHNFLQAMLSSIASCCMNSLIKSWEFKTVHFGSSLAWIAFLLVHKHTDFFSFILRRWSWYGRTERQWQSNDLIAGKEKKKAQAVILVYDIYLVVKLKYRQTQGSIPCWQHKHKVTVVTLSFYNIHFHTNLDFIYENL